MTRKIHIGQLSEADEVTKLEYEFQCSGIDARFGPKITQKLLNGVEKYHFFS